MKTGERRQETKKRTKNKQTSSDINSRDPLHMKEYRNVMDSPQTKLNVKPFSFANTILAELLLCDKNRKEH